MLCASFYPSVFFFFCRSHQFWKRQGFTAWQCKWRKNPISITCPGSAPLWTSRCQSRTHQAKSVSQRRPALYRDIQLPCGCGKLSANLVHSKKSLFHRTCQCGIGTRPISYTPRKVLGTAKWLQRTLWQSRTCRAKFVSQWWPVLYRYLTHYHAKK